MVADWIEEIANLSDEEFVRECRRYPLDVRKAVFRKLMNAFRRLEVKEQEAKGEEVVVE